MGTTKEINIKNWTYYFNNDYINLDELLIINIINLVIKSVNPLYLRIVDIKGQFEKGKDDAWYLVISDKDDVYKRLLDILQSIKNKIMEKAWDAFEYDKDYMKRKFDSNNVFPINKDVNIHLAAIVIRATFAKDGKYYPQLFLDGGLYKNVSVLKNRYFRWNRCS